MLVVMVPVMFVALFPAVMWAESARASPLPIRSDLVIVLAV